MENIFKTMNTKFLSESAWFCRRCDKEHFGVFFGSQFQQLFTYKTRTLRFTRQCSDIIHMSWKTLKRKFIQDNAYQILSELTWFCGRYDKIILVYFFGSQCISVFATRVHGPCSSCSMYRVLICLNFKPLVHYRTTSIDFSLTLNVSSKKTRADYILLNSLKEQDKFSGIILHTALILCLSILWLRDFEL